MEIQMNKRTADYIADQLADQILSGAIRGGTPLKQEELSGLLGASRIPVREALQIIEHQGLAVRLATRHVVTADFSDAHIREIYGIIGDIERRVLCDLASSAILNAVCSAILQHRSSRERIPVFLWRRR